MLSIRECDICNFADDNTLFSCDPSIENVLRHLNNDIDISLNWFKSNFMVANPAKFQVIFLGTGINITGLNINGKFVEATDTVKLLGVTLDNKLNFVPHIKDMCYKARNKTKALLRIRNNLDTSKATLLCNTFILSCFNYCPIIWMFSNKEGNNIINSTHRRVLRAILNDFSLPFEDMLITTGQTNIHKKNLGVLALEVYKSINGLNPQFMHELYTPKCTTYNLRKGTMLQLPPKVDLNSWHFRSVLVWNNLPRILKEAQSIDSFKCSLTKCRLYCQCKICR